MSRGTFIFDLVLLVNAGDLVFFFEIDAGGRGMGIRDRDSSGGTGMGINGTNVGGRLAMDDWWRKYIILR